METVVYVCENADICGYEETEQAAADRNYTEECPRCGGGMMGAD